jgi:tetratricopeptide (TPR) repeat protein
LLLGVVFLAYLALRESGLAKANLAEARTAVDEMLLTAGSQSAPDAEAADVPQMMAFREELLTKAKTFYLDLAHQEPGNEGLRAGMAQAHSRLGDIDRFLHKSSDAANEYNEAIQEYASMLKQYSAKPEYREALGYAYNFLGETLRPQQNSASDAKKAYDNALQIQQELVHENQGKTKYQQELARTYYNRGILRHGMKQPDDSEADFNEAIQLLEPLALKATDPSISQELARVYNNLGILLEEKDQRPEATTKFKKAIAIDEGLTKKVPKDREYKLELATYYNNFAMLLLAEKQVDAAKQYNLQTLNLIEDLTAPSLTLSIKLADVHNLRAQILETQDPKEAQANCQRSMEILEKLKKSEDSSDLPELQRVFRDLGYNYAELAKRSLKSGSRADAQAALNNLSRLLPNVSEQDRTSLTDYYQQILDEMAKPN